MMKPSNAPRYIRTTPRELSDTCLDQIAGAGPHLMAPDPKPQLKPQPQFTQALGEDGGTLPDPSLW
ncbi:hypothetical protein IT774_01555 [Salinimonas marina]|uniref:Uncharacterized protein n=1 Tax=Salinimonas marina TaxID=2785918 RepID=A0A7S9HDV7_9ALTE|nr:hypothetical protein [Salinimonas marina]QPG05971.1 hypothetical protein IT774_01555 [Salinimonas marina]